MVDRAIIFDYIRNVNGTVTADQVKAGDEIMNKVGEAVMARFLGVGSMLTVEKLQKIYPSANNTFVDAINRYAIQYDINSKERLAAFLAQVLHETNGFNKLRESLAYSAERLRAVFPSRFKNVAAAQNVVTKGQVAIGDAIYGGRLGNTNAGDGYKYRGGGLMHTTGKTNYQEVQNALIDNGIRVNLITNPELITTPDIAIQSAMIFWHNRNINAIADTKDITKVSRTVNGGDNGLKERTALYKKCLEVL